MGLKLSDDDCRRTTGLRSDEVVGYWFERRPWTGMSCDGGASGRSMQRVTGLSPSAAAPCPASGAPSLPSRGAGLRLALASSSSQELIAVVLATLGLEDVFEITVQRRPTRSAGKPDPAVYLTTLRRLGLPAGECVAFEDSTAGVQAAHAAGLLTIAVPAPRISTTPVSRSPTSS